MGKQLQTVREDFSYTFERKQNTGLKFHC